MQLMSGRGRLKQDYDRKILAKTGHPLAFRITEARVLLTTQLLGLVTQISGVTLQCVSTVSETMLGC